MPLGYSLEYVLECELMHGLLGVVLSLPLLLGYFLTRSHTVSSGQGEQATSNSAISQRGLLLLLVFFISISGHIVADIILLPAGLWKW